MYENWNGGGTNGKGTNQANNNNNTCSPCCGPTCTYKTDPQFTCMMWRQRATCQCSRPRHDTSRSGYTWLATTIATTTIMSDSFSFMWVVQGRLRRFGSPILSLKLKPDVRMMPWYAMIILGGGHTTMILYLPVVWGNHGIIYNLIFCNHQIWGRHIFRPICHQQPGWFRRVEVVVVPSHWPSIGGSWKKSSQS